MKVINWAMGLISQLVTYYVRPRNVGLGMMRWSATVFVPALASGVVVELRAGTENSFRFSTAEGPPLFILCTIVAAALVGWFVGMRLAARADQREADLNQISRVLVVELRGLVDTSDHPLIKAVPTHVRGRREDCLVDVRPHLTGSTPNVPTALDELAYLRRQVQRARGDTAREHVTVVVGGVMQVPLLFYAGTLIDDEGKVLLMDWERTQGQWKQLEHPDDGSRFASTGLEDVAGPEAVLAVSASYRVDLAGIEQTFPGFPVVHMARPDPKPNTLWSEEKQAALAGQFLDTLAELANRGVKTVHLVLAAPCSLSLRFGRVYDPRNMPNLRCYQRERDHVPPYPWSVQMPTAVLPVAYLLTPAPAVVAA